ncbi:MAG: endolytic transglycosylase MltG [Bacillota bacterium]
MPKRILLGLVLLVTSAAFLGYWGFQFITEPVPPGGEVSVVIPPGMNARGVSRILLEHGLIKSDWGFWLAVRKSNLSGQLKAGEYQIPRGLTLPEIIELLVKGQTATYPFTVPEGLTVVQTANLLEALGLVDSNRFLALTREAPLNHEHLPPGAKLPEPMEGYLFPETYKIPKRATEEDIIALMYQQFLEVFGEDLQARAEELGLSLHEVVILASVIEREAMVDSERTTISGVYHNRLRIGMKLDADPTVLYAHGRLDGQLTYADLEIDSPYNTYLYAGLPPGPIAAPGEASIRAALFPEDIDYLYFVSRNDGTHVFSRTYAEHLQNKAQYQPGG